MGIEFRPVEGTEAAPEAARLLSAAWPAPALHYSPAYLAWQLGFPGPWPAPAVAAMDGSTMVGFAASMHRRIRFRATTFDAVVVSFVAVHPDRRNRGIASGLYRHLISAIRGFSAPVITFAQVASAGQQVLESAYPAAGYRLCRLGEYPLFGCMVRPNERQTWRSADSSSASAALREVIDFIAVDENTIWSDPTEAQLEHYMRDPRGRQLLLHRGEDERIAAGWSVRTEFVSARGLEHVLTADSVWLGADRPDLLQSLASTIAGRSTVVHAPSLAMFDPARLRERGFRQVAAPFQGYLAVTESTDAFGGATSANIEVV